MLMLFSSAWNHCSRHIASCALSYRTTLPVALLQKSVARCLRACLALLLFLVSFADGREREEYVQLAWSSILKILVCLILCSVADVAKTLLAKLLSSHFHKRAHFDKMQDALNKVSACALCR
jgi:hypothetical protein